MNTTVITLNRSALASFAAPKVRVQNRDNVLYLRPTTRKSGVNLPKGEKLVELVRKGDSARIEVEGIEVPAGNLSLRADKYGWMATSTEAPARGEAAVKVG